MAFLETIKLCFDNNLILGFLPDKIALDKVGEKRLKDLATTLPSSFEGTLEEFGLFDSNQANYNTYYPDVTAEDLAPKDEEFIQPVFRALSEVIVHKDYNPVDFGENNVLKKSMPLLNGASVNVDHETSVGNAVGAVKSVSWENAYKTQSGLLVPAGINSKLKIDGKSHPRLARAIMMDPPAVHSTSVTVQFLWETSHPELSQDEFFSKVGSYDKDGKMVRRIATDIKRYHEISLVSHGADPYAQLIKDAEIVNPVWGNISYNSITGGQKQKQKYFFFDYKTDVIKNTIPKETNYNSNDNLQTDIMNKEFLIALAAIFGVKLPNAEEPGEVETQLIETTASNLINLRNTNATTITERDEEITRLKLIETAYNTEKVTFANAVALKAFQDARTEDLRTKLQANYKLVVGAKENDPVAKLIETASWETLQALNSQYTEQLDEKFPMSCKTCGGTEVNRASATQQEGDEDDKTVPSDIKEKLKNRARNESRKIKMYQESK